MRFVDPRIDQTVHSATCRESSCTSRAGLHWSQSRCYSRLHRRPRKFLELNPGNDYTAIGEFYWTKISVVRLWLGVTVAGMVMPELTNRTSPHIGRGTIMLQLAAVKTCNQTLSKLAIGRTKKLRLADE